MKRTNQKGMTLIEVLVALAILAFLATFTATSIRNALSSKSRIQKNIDLQSSLRDALRVMERDINLAFQYRDLNGLLHNLAVDERTKRLQKPGKDGKKPLPPRPAGFPPMAGETLDDAMNAPEALEKRPVRVLTQFVGEKNSLSFSSLGNVRLRADDKTSSSAEIGYSLKNCRRRTSQRESSKCLWRRVSPMIGTDITKGGAETVLLENVQEFSLRYLGPGKEEWVDTWISNERGDDVTKFNFPYAVEVTVEILDPDSKDKKKTLRMTQIASIRNPNNPVKASAGQDGAAANPEGETPVNPEDQEVTQ